MNVVGRVAAGSLMFLFLLQSASGGEHHTLRFLYPESRNAKKGCSLAVSSDGKEVALCVEPGMVYFVRTADGEHVAEVKANPVVMNYSRDGSRVLMVEKYESFSVATKTRQRFPVTLEEKPGALGLRIAERNGKLVVERIFEGSPAAGCGKFAVGDEIVGAGEGKVGRMDNVIGFSLAKCLGRTKGPVNTFVRVQVLHKGNPQPETVLLQRKLSVNKPDGTAEFLPLTVPPIADNLVLFERDSHSTIVSAADGRFIGSLIPEDLEPGGPYAISPDQRWYATLSRTRENPRKFGIEIFDLTKLERTHSLPFDRNSYSTLAFSADNKELLVGTWEWIDVFDVTTGKFQRSYRLDGKITTTFEPARQNQPRSILDSPGQKVQSIAVSPTLIAVSSALGTVELLDLETGASVKTFPLQAKEQIYRNRLVEFLSFSPDGRWLVFYVNGLLNIVDVTDIKLGAKAS